MKISKRLLPALAFASILAGAASAQAAHITTNIVFVTQGVTEVFTSTGFPPPANPVGGSFTIGFDPTVETIDSTSNITVNLLNIPVGSPVAFSYHPSDDSLVIGGANYGVNGILLGTNDFFLSIHHLSSNPTPFVFNFGTSNGAYYGGYPVTLLTNSVPEPATWAMMLLGFGALGAALRRRRAVAAA